MEIVRKTAIPKREIQVLERLREAREKLGLSQPAFAGQLDITRSKLANFENFKTPLPCDLAFKVCLQFIIGERWLATGEGGMRQFMALSHHVSDPSLYRMPFGAAYDKGLAEAANMEFERMGKEGALFTVIKIAFWNSNRHFYKNFINALLDSWMDALEKEGKAEDWGDLARMLAVSGQDHYAHLADRVLKHDEKTDEIYWESAATGKRWKFDPLENIDETSARRKEEQLERARAWDRAKKMLLKKGAKK
jgi:transcriptional regulator with XRE-family HTH domain